MNNETAIPELALSVRQPWAWAIIHGGKNIENRTLKSIVAGGMKPGRICIHAASHMTKKEYQWGAWRLNKHGVHCPLPDELTRGAIIGRVDVIAILSDSDSEWFGGPCGLALDGPIPLTPIPCRGALGFFKWKDQPRGDIEKPKPWMTQLSQNTESDQNPTLFNVDFSVKEPPLKPFGRKR